MFKAAYLEIVRENGATVAQVAESWDIEPGAMLRRLTFVEGKRCTVPFVATLVELIPGVTDAQRRRLYCAAFGLVAS